MPRVVITFEPEHHEYYVELAQKDTEYDPEYQVVVDLKASHYRNIVRNSDRVARDQQFLQNFMIQAQGSGRHLREQ